MSTHDEPIEVCVVGLWHLGLVTSAALASLGIKVVGLSLDEDAVEKIRSNRLPIVEPGLAELVTASKASGHLGFTYSPEEALSDADVVWVAIDTPVDEEDVADPAAVIGLLETLFPFMSNGPLVIVSSQLPIGSTQSLADTFGVLRDSDSADFVCVPENLRLGVAVERFLTPDRIVVGADSDRARERARAFLKCIDAPIVEMSTRGAEATKHAINSFLAVSIAFANEVGTVCSLNGVNPREVEVGLKTDERIGSRAYLRAGEGFAGGTLGRDVRYLEEYCSDLQGGLPLIEAIRKSNSSYLQWPLRAIAALDANGLLNLDKARVCILGMTYKSTTNTTRRSTAVEFGNNLIGRGIDVVGYSPFPLAELEHIGFPLVTGDPIEALEGADVAIVMTDSREITTLSAEDFAGRMRTPIVIDYGRNVGAEVRGDGRVVVLDSETVRIAPAED